MKFAILKKHLSSSPKGRDNLNDFLGSQRSSYNKVSLGYEPNSNSRNFNKFCNAKAIFECKL